MKLNQEIIDEFNAWQKGKGGGIDLSQVEFETVSFSNSALFTFVKGKNAYIKRYNENHPGDIPLATGSVKNGGIAYYVEPIDPNDVIATECVSYNKDGDTMPFYRNMPFLMDRHHVAILPNLEMISAKYVYYYLNHFFQHADYSWGDNTANAEVVAANSMQIPKRENSLAIQKEIVAFIEEQQTRIHGWIDAASDLMRVIDEYGKLILAKTFAPEKSQDLIDLFNIWQTKFDRPRIDLSQVEFEEKNVFQVLYDEGRLVGPKKLESSQPKIRVHANPDGVPVYSGKNGELCRVLATQYPDKLFESDEDNPSISFAANGDGSAGRNFVIHEGKFYINQERTVVDFKGHTGLFSRYVLYGIRDMREIYDMNQQRRATPTDLPRYGLMLPIPKVENSLDIQKEIVAFIEAYENWQANVQSCYDSFVTVSKEYEQLLLAKMFQGERG